MHTTEFVYTGRAVRVVFGAGKRSTLAEEVRLLGARRALVICGAEQRALGEALGHGLAEQRPQLGVAPVALPFAQR